MSPPPLVWARAVECVFVVFFPFSSMGLLWHVDVGGLFPLESPPFTFVSSFFFFDIGSAGVVLLLSVPESAWNLFRVFASCFGATPYRSPTFPLLAPPFLDGLPLSGFPPSYNDPTFESDHLRKLSFHASRRFVVYPSSGRQWKRLFRILLH